MRLPTVVTGAVLCVLAGGRAWASGQTVAGRRSIAAVKATAAPVIDGDLGDAVWAGAPVAEGFADLQSGLTAADQTTVRILYDAKYIYVAFRCVDSHPEMILARETVRDYAFSGSVDQLSEDSAIVTLDPFHQRSDDGLSRFGVNALGTRSSAIAGGRGSKREWRGEWDAAAKRTAEGWSAEMRIPWEILNYPSGKRDVTMGINFARTQSRTRIYSVWSNVGPQGFNELAGRWQGVEPPAGAFRPALSALPYALAGVGGSERIGRVGLNARYTITPELTAVGAVNPDFSTIERAVEGIQFSRGERYVSERRPFFQEGGEFFRLSTIQVLGSYFYTPRIPAFDVGANVYGKSSREGTVGLVYAHDTGGRSDLAAKYRHQFSETAGADFMLLQKSAAGDHNTVGLLHHDARWGKLMLDAKCAFTSGAGAGGGSQELGLLYLEKQMIWGFAGASIDRTFRDANGFIQFNDYRGALLLAQYNSEWRKGFWRRGFFNITPLYFVHTDGRPFQRGVQGNFSVDTRSDWRLNLDVTHLAFEDQTDRTVALTVSHGSSNRFRTWGVTVQTGMQGGSPSTFIGPSMSLRVLRKLDLTYEGAVVNLEGVNQQHIGTANYALTPSQSIGGRIVLANALANWYLQYHNSGERGTETYFIIGDPNAPRFVRQALMKMVFAI